MKKSVVEQLQEELHLWRLFHECTLSLAKLVSQNNDNDLAELLLFREKLIHHLENSGPYFHEYLNSKNQEFAHYANQIKELILQSRTIDFQIGEWLLKQRNRIELLLSDFQKRKQQAKAYTSAYINTPQYVQKHI